MTTVVQTAIRTIPQILVISLGIILPLAIMISMDAILAAVVILPAVLFVFSSAWFGKRMKAAQRPALDAEAGIQSYLKETLPSAPLIRVFGLEDWAEKNYDRQFQRFSDTSVSVIKLSSLSAAVTMLIYSVPTILILTLGSLSVLAGNHHGRDTDCVYRVCQPLSLPGPAGLGPLEFLQDFPGIL